MWFLLFASLVGLALQYRKEKQGKNTIAISANSFQSELSEAPVSNMVQLLSTNDVYKTRGDRWTDNGNAPFVLEDGQDGKVGLLSKGPQDKSGHGDYIDKAWSNLQQAFRDLPNSFPEQFYHRELCKDKDKDNEWPDKEKQMCEAIIPSFSQWSLRQIDIKFAQTGKLWREDSLGCVENMDKLSKIIENPNTPFGNLADMGMTYVVESHKFMTSNNQSQNTFSFLPGDFLGPSFLSFRNQGKHMTEILDQVVDFVTLGNHEFDFKMKEGASVLNGILEKAKYKSMTANVNCKHDTNGNCAEEQQHHGGVWNNLKETVRNLGNGKHLCIFGVTSHQDASASDGGKGFSFKPYDEKGIEVLKSFKGQSCDLVVAMTHLDLAQDLDLWYKAVQCYGRGECAHIDVMLGAHNHYVAMLNLKNPFTQGNSNRDYTYMWKMGQNGHLLSKVLVDLTWQKRPTISLVPVVSRSCAELFAEGSPQRKTYDSFEKIVSDAENDFKIPQLRDNKLKVTFKGRWDSSSNIEKFETRTANFFADAAAASDGGSDLAVLTAGMARADKFQLMDGRLSTLDIHEDFPFSVNKLAQIHVTVWQIVSLVMEGLLDRRSSPESGARLIISGLEVVFAVDEDGQMDSGHKFLGLKELRFVGSQHMLGTRRLKVDGNQKGKHVEQIWFKDGVFLVDPKQIHTLVSNSYHLFSASPIKEPMSLRFSGEVANREDGCKQGAGPSESFENDFACDAEKPGKMKIEFYKHLDTLMKNKEPAIFGALSATTYDNGKSKSKVFDERGVWALRSTHPVDKSKGNLGSDTDCMADAMVEGIGTYGPEKVGMEIKPGFIDGLVMEDRNLDVVRWRPDKLEDYWGLQLNDNKMQEGLQDKAVRAALRHLLDETGLTTYNVTKGTHHPLQQGFEELAAQKKLEKAIQKAAQTWLGKTIKRKTAP